MALSALDIFRIGIGPSSSHTVGPMRAARQFVLELERERLLAATATLRVALHGSLGETGKGHGSSEAVLAGLEGGQPEHIDVDAMRARVAEIRASRQLRLPGGHVLRFVEPEHLLYFRKPLSAHPNGMRFEARSAAGELLAHREYCSVGGGFIVGASIDDHSASPVELPHPFATGAELLERCRAGGSSISALMRANEAAFRPAAQTHASLAELWRVMQECVAAGCRNEGRLPGPLGIRRRAPSLSTQLRNGGDAGDPLLVLDWVSLYALAVNEENATGGRVVTAPTNGAAGIVPAVLHYYMRFVPGADAEGVERFLLVAAAIAMLYKTNASISGAEVGCQGEVGVACSMAAGALAEVMGGTPLQVENAAEIGMEHNLGLTCDPVGGRVQVPCIERNALGAVKAIQAARIALRGDGQHYVSLDKVIKTMRETGADMKRQYKETSRGGLAVNVIEC